MVSKNKQAFVQQGPKPEGIGSLIPTVCLAVIFALVASWFQMRMVELEKGVNNQRIAHAIQVIYASSFNIYFVFILYFHCKFMEINKIFCSAICQSIYYCYITLFEHFQ